MRRGSSRARATGPPAAAASGRFAAAASHPPPRLSAAEPHPRVLSSGAAATSAEPAIGIDLGTTNCACAAVGSNGKPFLIPAADGARVSPSVVSYVATPAAAADELPAPLLSPLGAANSTRVLVGARAQRQWVTNPHSTYASTKRLIGRTASSAELRALAALDVPHSVSGGGQEREVLLACPALRRALSPVDAAAELVRALVGQAEAALAHKVRRAVVTVPAYFDDGQRLATETACMLSGLEEVKLLREPEAVRRACEATERAS